jgi:ribosome biogenesis GTPase
MSRILDTRLTALGWNDRLQRELEERFGAGAEAARVIRPGMGLYLLRSATREAKGRLTGAFEYRLAGTGGVPVVGDWVAVEAAEDSAAPYRIVGLLERSGVISRKQAGRETVEQILASNVDIGCIVFSLEGGRKSNPRAAERYATMVWGSGALPLILLNKADVAADVEQSVGEIAAVAPGVDVLPISCTTGDGIEEVRRRLAGGKTAVLLGPSGVGKSTLINVLAGDERQAVGEIRDGDMKGRHTTTHRELVFLPEGAMIIDTPGLRELQLWADESDLAGSFSDIAEIADGCRFRDCTHSGEPGCAVQAALNDGGLTHERFASYLELRKEIAYLERRSNDKLRREEREKWKKINQTMRGFNKERRAKGG